MAGEQVEPSYPVKVFADDAETRLLVRVTETGDVHVTDDMKWDEAVTAITRLSKLVLKLRNDDALRIEEEKMLDERLGARPKLKQEILRLRADLEETRRQLAKAKAAGAQDVDF